MKNEKKVECSKCGKGESRRKKVVILERGNERWDGQQCVYIRTYVVKL